VDEVVHVAVVGAHLKGEPLHHQLTDRNARLVQRTRTASCYRMYALATEPPKPGLVRVAPDDPAAGTVDVEVWALAAAPFATFVDAIPAPLVIGRLMLADGTDVAGFLCEPIGIEGATEITRFGGWRSYLAALAAPR
jgi:allophanate hydrolase